MPDWSKVGNFDDDDGRILTATFTSQTHAEHLGMVLGAVVVWSLLYFAVLIVVAGGIGAGIQETSAALTARRVAFQWANIGCGLYFGAAVLRGLGGPILNILYLAALTAVNPELSHVVLGSTPDPLVSTAEWHYVYKADVAPLVLPGVLALFGSVFLWLAVFYRDSERLDEWFQTHWPEIWVEGE